jgi:hypothetical protein
MSDIPQINIEAHWKKQETRSDTKKETDDEKAKAHTGR